MPALTEQMEKLRRYAGVSPDDEEGISVLEDCALAAEEYLRGSDVDMTGESALRELTLRKLALYWWDHRSADRQYGYPAPPPDLNALVLSLRKAPAAPEGGASP